MTRQWRGEHALPEILEELRERTRALEAVCNPDQQNLHFGVRVTTNPALLERLHDIGLEAWRAVEHRPSWEASFWFYDWFLLLANMALEIWNGKTRQEYPDTVARRLAVLLVDISQMIMQEQYQGDIQKRLFEAFAHVLLAFGQTPGLLEEVKIRARETNRPQVIGFVDATIEAADRIARETHQP